MKAIFSTWASYLAILTGFLFASVGQAATVNLNVSNALGTNPSGTDFLFVTVTDGQSGAIDFRVEINPALLDSKGKDKLGIQDFSFNFGDLGLTEENLVLPDGWSATFGDVQHSNFGSFDVQLSGTGNSRQNPLLFSVQGIAGDTVNDYISHLSVNGQLASPFAAHVPGLNVTGAGGAHYGATSVVPIPAAAWLMLSALGLLVLRARAKASRKTAPVSRAVPKQSPVIGHWDAQQIIVF